MNARELFLDGLDKIHNIAEENIKLSQIVKDLSSYSVNTKMCSDKEIAMLADAVSKLDQVLTARQIKLAYECINLKEIGEQV